MSQFKFSQSISVIDSHTGGEPTRVVIEGGPDLGAGTLVERREVFSKRFDAFRSAIVQEPRGSDVLVGALLCQPLDPTCVAGMIFFNNVGYLGMCLHGTIGVVRTLAYLKQISLGEHRLETPVGVVTATLHEDGSVSVRNVPSYRCQKGVSVDHPQHGTVTGDVAWGGNWFFLVKEPSTELRLDEVDQLTDFAWQVRKALARKGITAEDGAEVDHIELFGPPTLAGADSKNFVLCPGKVYDRSPCGTGTSAKIACLIADGHLQPGEIWRQESIVGSLFEGSGELHGERVVPTIRGNDYITAEAKLLRQRDDPYQAGMPR